MPKAYKHFIITRFNLRDKHWGDYTKNATKVLTEDWLKERFSLFTDFCFPSVINQTNKNFEWWVYFDNETPPVYQAKIEELKKQSTLFRPIFVDGMESFLPHIQKTIKNCGADYLITSRLDNDDALHKNYVEFIQSQFSFQENVAFDLLAGYTLQVEPTTYFGYKEQLYNPFISYVEKNKNAQSVWKQSHTDWKKEKHIKRFKERLWLSIIHDSNKVNEYTGYGQPSIDILEQFHLAESKITAIAQQRKYNPIQSFSNKVSTTLGIMFKDLKKKLGKYN